MRNRLRYNSGVQSILLLTVALLLGGGRAPGGVPQRGEIRGRVVDARGGEALARVRVQLEDVPVQTVTDAAGEFVLTGVPPGRHVLRVSTVGYRLVRKEFSLDPSVPQEFEVIVTPETLRQTDSVEVKAGPFEVSLEENPSEMSLSGNELKNLSSVLADDPLRAVQSLPGVASNDDFRSRFSLRGADDHRVGLYLDDILLHSPFFAVQGESSSGSITALNGDILDDVGLQNGAFPARYADSTAGALDLRTREGSRVRPGVRLTVSAASASALAEGPFGKKGRGDWLAGVRKSYLQYVVKRVSDDPSLAFGFLDGEAKFGYDLGQSHHLSLSGMNGLSNLDRSSFRSELGPFSILNGSYHLSLANLGWRYAPGERFLLTNRVAFIEERFINHNPDDLPLLSGRYGEWVWNSRGTWLWRGKDVIDFGWSVRRIRNDSFLNVPIAGTRSSASSPASVLTLDSSRGLGLRVGGFVEQSWTAVPQRVFLSAGLRWDRHSVGGVQAVSPQASLSFLPRRSTRFHVGWGQYAQYPDLMFLFSRYGGSRLLPERASQLTADVEQRLDERTRVRVEYYQRWDRDLLLRAFYQPATNGPLVPYPPSLDPVSNSARAASRAVEIFLQRRSANRLSGWVSYAFGRTRLDDALTGLTSPSDRDQRHAVNLYLGYRVRPTLNLGLKALYGSGFPIPGFYRREGSGYFLSDTRNALRLSAYGRADFRANKDFTFNRWKLTVYAEVLNLLNRGNLRFETLNGFNPLTRQAYLSFNKMIPILPSGGVALQY